MADLTLNGGTVFPEGTSVGAYPRNRWSVEGVTGAPTGSAVASGTITGGTVTFTGLSDSTEYIAYASSPDRYKRFSTPPPSAGSRGVFDVTKYGAKGDGTTDNSAAFAAAIADAQAAGGGDVTVPYASAPYMVAGGALLLQNNVHIVGIGRPTLKLIGGANVAGCIFRTTLGKTNWGVRGLILDGNQSNITSVNGLNAIIHFGRNNANVRIVDNEIANTPNHAISCDSSQVGDTGTFNVWVLNNYMHDIVGVGNQVGMYVVAWKNCVIVGNRIVNSYDDNFAMISPYIDANDYCANNVVAYNTFDTSLTSGNIVLTGSGHRCIGNRCLNACSTGSNFESGGIRIRGSNNDNNPNKTFPYDVVCAYNEISTCMDGTHGTPGIYVAAARSQIVGNRIMMPVASMTNLVGIRLGNDNASPILPSPAGQIDVHDNQIHRGYRSIEYEPVSGGIAKVRIRRNSCYGANSHGIFVNPPDGDFVEVADNLTDGAGGDGIRWTGTWTDGLASNNVARGCTGYGLNIPSGTQTRTRVRGNVATNCTAGRENIAINAIRERYMPRITGLVAAHAFHPMDQTGQAALAALVPWAVRVVVPESGTLHDLALLVASASGNVGMAVYDTGDTTAGVRTKLFATSGVAISSSGWKIIGDPGIAVYAGQELDFLFTADNATATFGRRTSAATSAGVLPSGFGPVPGGVQPKFVYSIPAIASLAAADWPATIAEATAVVNTPQYFMIARVS